MTLVGRDVERRAVVDAIRVDRPVLVVGEPGIGKTSLIRAGAAEAGRPLREGGAFATLAWMPYLALARAVGRHLDGDAAWVATAVEHVVGPDVLFVDDLHWADAGTVEVVARLAPRLAVVVAIRPGGDDADERIATLRAAGFDVLELGPLAEGPAAEVAVRARPDLDAGRAQSVAERAGGNPFVIEQLVAGGDASPSLRRAIAARLDPLTPSARSRLLRLALAEHPLSLDAVGPADQLVAAGLAVMAPDGLAIRHALLAEEVRRAASPAETRIAHGELAELLHDPGERARHLAAAGEPAAAHELALQALGDATTPGERAAHLGVAAATATGPAADELRVEAAAALRVAGDLAGAAAALDAIEGDDPEVRARAEAVRARVQWSSGDPEAMRASIGRGLALVDGRTSPAAALLRAEAVTVTALVDGQFDQGLRDAESAVALARDAGADPTRALLLRATILAGLGQPGWEDALEVVVASARAAGDPETELSAANNLVSGHEMHGRPDAGRSLAGAMLERARELRLRGWERQFSAMIANLDLHRGDLRGALVRSQALLEEPLDPLAEQQVGLIAALALVDLGRADDAGPLLERLLAAASPDVTGRGDVLFVLAEAATWGGRPDEALARLDAYRAFEASEYPTSFLVDVASAWAALEAGRSLPPRLARGEAVGMLVGANLERGALERLAAGDPAGAATRFAEAEAAYRGFHRRGELRAGWGAGEALRRSNDHGPAVAQLERIEIASMADGFNALLGRIRRSLRLAGVRRSARSTPDAATTGSAILTPRERELAALVGRGLTNTEIARRMGLGRPTVARLLSNAMLKFGADSRTQLAGRVEELV
ncbi:MAG: hypothetical protein HYX57_10185 [Chloroflexi bacterium]|nr:hypothetical protein [Chloroflexota bacterium]